ncbi:hypothetical protein J2S13_001349 [Oikeobacillus pervagus]|uniref:FRG domain-containing protein n=1 Tax=Oikeobacillus pervagus TaxID=1325931 RepID=A0AAJ1WIS2_9BACI|nr:FRG domain-containing protein [Oikeobacillus pervagus]MDQ0214950.1 hypothetical protein [Oikeobacillus pervagus]
MITSTSIFDNSIICEVDLTRNEDTLQRILKEYEEEVQKLSQMDEYQIKEELSKVISPTREKEKFEFYQNNLLYIKQSFFIIQKDKKEENLDSEAIKQLRIEDIIEEIPSEISSSLRISYRELNEIAKKKAEASEQWNEYNVVSTVASKLGIEEANIKLISTLSEYISFVSELHTAEEYVSRGQKDCTYELLPSLHRNHTKDYSVHLSAYEGAFKQKIIYYDKDIIGKSAEAMRAEGQHFGLPTDYLDFTEAHLISLLFAIEEYNYDKQHSIVYFVNALEYNTEVIGQREKLVDYSIQSNVDTINGKVGSSRSYFIKLGNSNERIHFQKGCFLKFSVEDKESFRERLGKFCKVAIIDKNHKKDILKELFNLGVTFENIYPDKDNVVKSIKFQYKEVTGGNIG